MTDTAKDEAEIRAMVAAWDRALEAKDADGLVAHYAEDVQIYDAIPPYVTRSRDAYRAIWVACLPFFPDKVRSEHRDLTVAVSGDTAFLHGLHHVQPLGEGEENHPAGQTWLRMTSCLKRIGGAWRVVHEHISVPFDPMTEKVFYIPDPDRIEQPEWPQPEGGDKG